MQRIVDNLLDQYERGTLTRRQLAQALLLVALPSAAQVTQQTSALRPASFDHVAIAVSDISRSREFYEKLFGATVASRPDGSQFQFPLARKPQHVNLNKAENGKVGIDHFAITVEDFVLDRAIAAVKRAIPEAKVEAATDGSIDIFDPDGVRIQIEPIR